VARKGSSLPRGRGRVETGADRSASAVFPAPIGFDHDVTELQGAGNHREVTIVATTVVRRRCATIAGSGARRFRL
jgi:hypothetical protein